jgi:Fic/DOC family
MRLNVTKTSVGYQALIERFQLTVMPHYRASFITDHSKVTVTVTNGYEEHAYSKHYALKDPADVFAQLEFALKHDGLNLEILTLLFQLIEVQKITEWIQERPNSKYTRKVWFLYEMLMETTLNIPDIKGIKYIELLSSTECFTAAPVNSPRHSIKNNLLGDKSFCPMIRRTQKIMSFFDKNLEAKANKILQQYAPEIISRANNYLLAKETLSSYEIEREKPDKKRMAKFIDFLQRSSSIKTLTKNILIECQNVIVDSRFMEVNYRDSQNYIAENINQYYQKVDYICPKPEDIEELMQGWFDLLLTMKGSTLHPVIMASIVSFGFVFLHPFEDGNGRLHRFLLHYILSQCGFTPADMIFPISATMLQSMRDYDEVLESVSKPIMTIITDYDLDNDGVMVVKQQTKHHYQYLDYTNITEYLFACIEETIDVHLAKEINFLVNYDKAKQSLKDVVDMPDNLIDLFIRCVQQNNGKLSEKKRQRYFYMLTGEELKAFTTIVATNMLTEKLN